MPEFSNPSDVPPPIEHTIDDTLDNTDTESPSLTTLKTSRLDRRLSIAKASFNIGRRWAGNSVGGLFLSKEARASRNQAFMQQQADYLVSELGKLKGSVVKVGQMLALYGEHFLPPEITTALQSLNDDTASLSWAVVHKTLQAELGDKLMQLDVETTPIGTASLAQVHRAVVKATGEQVVLKVQYPGVADAIESDLSLFRHLLKVTNAVPQTKALDDWFVEIEDLLKTEVNYHIEAQTTQRFYERLADDERYVVPRIKPEFSTNKVLCMSFEAGSAITQVDFEQLSQTRRNALGQAVLEIFLQEVFVWGEMQTDPNFGNYLLRLQSEDGNKQDIDQLILLDFGAIRQFDSKLLNIARGLMLAGFTGDKNAMMDAMQGYDFFDSMNERDKANMAEVFLLATEPFRQHEPASFNQTEQTGEADKKVGYHWASSNLHKRLIEKSTAAMQTRAFVLPPKEFMFISRKFIGVYTFLTVLDATTTVNDILPQFMPLPTAD